MRSMPPGKKSPALFELIREKPAPVVPPRPPEQAVQKPPAQSPPPPIVESKPTAPPVVEPEPAAPSAAAPTAPADEASPALSQATSPAHRPVLLTYLLDPQRRMSVVFVSIAAILAYTVIVWGLAYSFGEKQGEQTAVRDLSVPDGTLEVRDPLRNPPAPGPDRASQGGAPPPRGTPAAQPNPTPPGMITGDPRTPGLNYLAVEGRLDLDSARQIAAFLTGNGVPSIVVGADGRVVDSRTPQANNAGPFTVYATKGITGKEFRDRATVRTDLEAEVARLGAIWKREHKGTTDFTRTNWAKHSPPRTDR